MSETEPVNFDKIATVINSRSDEIRKLLEKCKVSCSIPPVSVFDDRYSFKHATLQKKSTGEETPDTVASPSDLAEAFKALENIPPNFPKPARKHNSSISINKQNCSKRNNDRNDSFSSSLVSNVSGAKVSVEDICTTTNRTFNECLERTHRFEKGFKNVKVSSQTAKQQFKENAQNLRRAMEDLEKLMPRGTKDNVVLFDSVEEKAIADFRGEVDAFVSVQENKDIYPSVEMTDDGDLDVVSKLAGDLLPR